MEGHGGQTLSSYLLTLPFYFVTVFISFFPWSIKLPALAKRLWRERDAVDKYLISGTAIVFILMTLVKTKLPHYTLIAFPLLSLLLARHLFDLPGFFVQMLRRRFPSLRDRFESRTSPRFPVRTAVIAFAVSLAVSLFVFRLIAPHYSHGRTLQEGRKGPPSGHAFRAPRLRRTERGLVFSRPRAAISRAGHYRGQGRLIHDASRDRSSSSCRRRWPEPFTRNFRQVGNLTPSKATTL